jgi:dynactin-6
MPSAPKAPTKIDHSAIIADKAILTGTHPITVLGRAVIHPYAKVVSQAGPVEIGDGAIVWEKAVVGVAVPDGAVVGAEMSTQSVLLGRNVVVETGAIVEGEVVGEGTVVECFARIGLGARIGKVGDRFILVDQSCG